MKNSIVEVCRVPVHYSTVQCNTVNYNTVQCITIPSIIIIVIMSIKKLYSNMGLLP